MTTYRDGQLEFKLKDTHISTVQAGDTIFHDDKLKTVSGNNIKRDSFMGTSIFGDSFMGTSIFGDSYMMGRKPVKVATHLRRVTSHLTSIPQPL